MAARDVAKVISFQAKRRGKPTGKPTGKPQSDHHHTKLQGADGVRDGHCKLPVIYEPMGKAADTAAGPHIVEGATGGVFSIAARAPDDDCNKSSAAAVTIESAEQAQRGGCGGTKKQPLPPKKQKTTATGASHGQTSAGCRARGDSTPAATPSSWGSTSAVWPSKTSKSVSASSSAFSPVCRSGSRKKGAMVPPGALKRIAAQATARKRSSSSGFVRPPQAVCAPPPPPRHLPRPFVVDGHGDIDTDDPELISLQQPQGQQNDVHVNAPNISYDRGGRTVTQSRLAGQDQLSSHGSGPVSPAVSVDGSPPSSPWVAAGYVLPADEYEIHC